jgi:hypothetical protein
MEEAKNGIFAYSDALLAKTEEWKKAGGFTHRKPCKEWKQHKNCNHYARARYRHFKPEIDALLSMMGFSEAKPKAKKELS